MDDHDINFYNFSVPTMVDPDLADRLTRGEMINAACEVASDHIQNMPMAERIPAFWLEHMPDRPSGELSKADALEVAIEFLRAELQRMRRAGET